MYDAQLLAGFAKSDITPKLGCELVGYGNRASGATSVHDPLFARAAFFAHGDQRQALISCEFCFLNHATIRDIRAAVAAQIDIDPVHIFIATTHTHSGPHDRDAANWDRPLAGLVAQAVVDAHARLQPARLAGGYGMLYNYSINRRWIDRPVDPGLGVIRVDSLSGQLLGLIANFACHAVVMGPDNLAISADWPGHACTKFEQEAGDGAVCIFTQGGTGNINPLVAGVREQLRSGRPVVAIGDVSHYYGPRDAANRYNVGDRTGGTFAEVAELGDAFVAELWHVARGLTPTDHPQPLWASQTTISALAGPDEHYDITPLRAPSVREYEELRAAGLPAEIMFFRLGDALLVGQPGEVFSETAVRLKTYLRAAGVATPLLVSYANGWLSYLPEPEDFPEGGYEVARAVGMGTSRDFQPRVRQTIHSVIGS